MLTVASLMDAHGRTLSGQKRTVKPRIRMIDVLKEGSFVKMNRRAKGRMWRKCQVDSRE